MCLSKKKIQRALVSLEDLIERKVIAQVWHKVTAQHPLHVHVSFVNTFFPDTTRRIFSGTVK